MLTALWVEQIQLPVGCHPAARLVVIPFFLGGSTVNHPNSISALKVTYRCASDVDFQLSIDDAAGVEHGGTTVVGMSL